MSQIPKAAILLSDCESYRGWEDYYKESDDAWGETPPPFLPGILASKLDKGQSIVDYGAGNGRNSLGLAKDGYHLTLVDISAAGLQRAAERVTGLGVRPMPTLVVASLEQLPLGDNQFDCALCIDALPQVHRPRKALEEMARTIRAGGILVVNVFTTKDAAFNQGEPLSARSFLYKNTFFSFWEDEDFRPLLTDLFEVIECRSVRWDDPAHIPFRPYPHTHDALVYVLRKN